MVLVEAVVAAVVVLLPALQMEMTEVVAEVVEVEVEVG